MNFFLLFLFAFTGLGDRWQYALSPPRSTPPVDVVWSEEVQPPREQELWYRVPLPASLPPEPHLVFRSFGAAFEVFVDQQRVYAFEDREAAGRMRLHSVPLWRAADSAAVPPATRRRGAGGTAGEAPALHYLYVRVPRGARLPILGGQPVIAARADVPRALVYAATSSLHGDLEDVALGAILIVIGIASAVISRVRRGGNTSSLLWFGVFTALYGLRLIADSSLPLLLGASTLHTAYAESWITYVIAVPGWLMGLALIGNGWRSTLRWQVWAFAIFAPIAILVSILRGEPDALEPANNALVIVGGVNILFNLFMTRKQHTRELRVVLAGSVVFMLFALVNNLGALTVGGIDETPGFIVFVGCLGYAAVRMFTRGESERVALEGELATAREIQRAILPTSMPAVSGLRFGARYDPASSVAGDFYDFVAVDDTHVGVVVADVAGHGVPAALIASMVKVAVSSHARAPPRATALRRLGG